MTDQPSESAAARRVMLAGRYGEPTDTYTWELVVDRCLHVLREAGFIIRPSGSDVRPEATNGS